MRTIFAEYNPQRNSIDVYTSAGYMLRIDCWEAEKNLKTTPGSDCALNALAIDEEAFASADMSDVKKLFAGDFSFGSNTQSRMLQLASDASANSSSVFYNQYGAVAGASVGSFYDSLF